MGEFFFSYGLFVAKLLTFLVLIVIALVFLISLGGRDRRSKGTLHVTHINEQLDQSREMMHSLVLDPADYKQSAKLKKKQLKQEAKANKAAAKVAAKNRGDGTTIVDEKKRKRKFLVDFKGDIQPSQVDNLRREVTAILSIADVYDEVTIKIESGGGTVHGYGLAAAQLQRIRDKNIELVVCVDKVAASGGYLMACVANRIFAAPFAMIGSIGVMAQIPNIHKLLKKHDIDVELLTAGEYKRTLTVLGENTDKGRQKFLEDIQVIHDQFKNTIARHRPQTDMSTVATGEVWSGEDALRLKLIDEITTSDAYVVKSCEEADVYSVKYEEKKSIQERFGAAASITADKFVDSLMQKLDKTRFL